MAQCPATHPGRGRPPAPKAHTPQTRDQDNRTFLHINSWTSPSGARATNLGLLAAGAGDEQLPQPVGGAPLALRAPVVLSATNDTLVPLLRERAAVPTPEPLLVYVGGNVTLAGGTSVEDGSAAPPAGGVAAQGRALARGENLTIARPVILVGRAADPTGIDFRMRVNQLVAAGPHARLTLDSLHLENLGFGDGAGDWPGLLGGGGGGRGVDQGWCHWLSAVCCLTVRLRRWWGVCRRRVRGKSQRHRLSLPRRPPTAVVSAPTAEGVQLPSTFSLWAFRYRRSEPRLLLRNCTSAIPESEAAFILYWSSMFEAGDPSTDWMRRDIDITSYKVGVGVVEVPGSTLQSPQQHHGACKAVAVLCFLSDFQCFRRVRGIARGGLCFYAPVLFDHRTRACHRSQA